MLTIDTPRTAWLEVIRPAVSRAGENMKELSSGDEVFSGMTLYVSKDGQAIIHFPDGSILRADSDTTIKIDESYFEPKSETLSVKVTLMGGKVWSKVIALVGSASVWQVKTSSAVATVRGTSFGTEYIAGKSMFLGSENEVKVAVVDPKTGKIKKETEASLISKTIIEVKDADMEKIAATPAPLAVFSAPSIITDAKWVRENQSADEEMGKIISEMRDEEGSDIGMREKMRELNERRREELKKETKSEIDEIKIEKTIEKSVERLKEIKKEVEKEEAEEEANTETKDTPKTTVDTDLKSTTEAGAVTAPSTATVKSTAKPTRAYIKGIQSGADIMEDSKIPLKLILVLSDGTERDITSSAKWAVKGNIGPVSTTGIFSPSFKEEEAEMESVLGEISATALIDGVSLSAPGITVKVVHFVEETELRG